MDEELDPQALDAAARAQYEHDVEMDMQRNAGRTRRHHYPEWGDAASPGDTRLYTELARRVVVAYLANVRKDE